MTDTSTDRPTTDASHTTNTTNTTEAVDRTAVPPDAEPHVCDYCGDPFTNEHHLALHWGLFHYADLTEEERAAYDDAHTEETAQLRRFRIIALGGLVLLYFVFLIVYEVIAV